jgi:DNA invertase Pin-like site-specific DNA recombinase
VSIKWAKERSRCRSPRKLITLCFIGTNRRHCTYGSVVRHIIPRRRVTRRLSCGHFIYREKVTGARGDWRELNKMLGKVASGDVVMVTRIDRLARSTFDLFGIVKRIVDAKAQLRSLAEPWADTGTSTGRLVLAVLGGLADVERDLIRTRTAEGRSRPKVQGQQMGRPPFPDTGPTERGQQTPRAGRYVAGIGAQLQCRHINHSPQHARRMTRAATISPSGLCRWHGDVLLAEVCV